MKLYAAPLQGFTESPWRNLHQEVFGGIDAYYTPDVYKRQVEHLLLYGHGIELAVAQLQFRFLFGRKPITQMCIRDRCPSCLYFKKYLAVFSWSISFIFLVMHPVAS